MRREPTECKTVTPSPYFKIIFGCSNRAFYEVKSDVVEIAQKEGLEWNDGYLTEKCDYEGDLEAIILYRGERCDKLTKSVLKFYGVEVDSIPSDMDVHLSIF